MNDNINMDVTIAGSMYASLPWILNLAHLTRCRNNLQQVGHDQKNRNPSTLKSLGVSNPKCIKKISNIGVLLIIYLREAYIDPAIVDALCAVCGKMTERKCPKLCITDSN
jgi:hypothetical protein